MEVVNPEIETKLMAAFCCFFSAIIKNCIHQEHLSVSTMKMTHTYKQPISDLLQLKTITINNYAH